MHNLFEYLNTQGVSIVANIRAVSRLVRKFFCEKLAPGRNKPMKIHQSVINKFSYLGCASSCYSLTPDQPTFTWWSSGITVILTVISSVQIQLKGQINGQQPKV